MPLLITTSRRPTRRTRTLIKELSRVIPGSIKMNRGKMSFDDLKELMIKKGITRLLLIDTRKGNPSRLNFMVLSSKGLKRKLIIIIDGVILQLDKRMQVRFSDIIDIKAENLPEEIYELFKYFLVLPALSPAEGVRGYVNIRYDNDMVEIGFRDSRGKKIYPFIRGRISFYEPL
jgi:U3 small nucleolar ribonucleoprotein protein IMP4